MKFSLGIETARSGGKGADLDHIVGATNGAANKCSSPAGARIGALTRVRVRRLGNRARVAYSTLACIGNPAAKLLVSRPRLGRPQSNTMPNPAPTPQSITLHQSSRLLEIGFSDGQNFRLPFELLRVYSPSAEVQGHGPGQEVLQTGKRGVEITDLATVGHYAVQPTFSDGHSSGIFSWSYLYELGSRQQDYWDRYLQRLADAGAERDAPMAVAAGSHCGHEH